MQLGTVIELLDQEAFVSGEDLATRLGVSRTMVWKQIQTLRELGYKIKAHPAGATIWFPGPINSTPGK